MLVIQEGHVQGVILSYYLKGNTGFSLCLYKSNIIYNTADFRFDITKTNWNQQTRFWHKSLEIGKLRTWADELKGVRYFYF